MPVMVATWLSGSAASIREASIRALIADDELLARQSIRHKNVLITT
jgi:hypothetical protein